MPSSSNVVNFSLRHNKAIERSIVFDGLQDIYRTLSIDSAAYIGFGSVWFSDFQVAHRQLGIREMVSIEWDETTYKRAKFNKPFRTIDVVYGRSDEVLEAVMTRESLKHRPIVIWLDYDEILDSTKLEELRGLAATLPPNSCLLTTFKVLANAYAKVRERQSSLNDLFKDDYKDYGLDLSEQNAFMLSLGDNLERVLLSSASRAGREAHGVPTFYLPYRDQMPMLTLGLFLPSQDTLTSSVELASGASWIGRTRQEISAPLLTAKEISALESRLPSTTKLTRQNVIDLGFDIDEARLESFGRYYARYPAFAQIAY